MQRISAILVSMSNRKLLIAANWKMHALPGDLGAYKSLSNADAWVFPSAFDLQTCIDAELITGGQCGHASDTGAHTGDISMAMLAEVGCTHVLCGHSERSVAIH